MVWTPPPTEPLHYSVRVRQTETGASTMKNTATISIDLAKTVFQVAVFNKYGKLKSNNKMNDKKMAIILLRFGTNCIFYHKYAPILLQVRTFSKHFIFKVLRKFVLRHYLRIHLNPINISLCCMRLLAFSGSML